MFNSETAAIRFGTGLSPVLEPPVDVAQMMATLLDKDQSALRFPVKKYGDFSQEFRDLTKVSRAYNKARKNGDIAQERALRKQRAAARRKIARQGSQDIENELVRGVTAQDGFRERLVWFWADHFTAHLKTGYGRTLTSSYIEEAIRPHVTGDFSDLLKSAALHPVMLRYLDQVRSIGPNSVLGQKNAKRGLNENLAREILELHTLGVDGSYAQADVREFARLLTGHNVKPNGLPTFVKRQAEPGDKRILDRRYAGSDSNQRATQTFLDDLSANPDTARHIAYKLAVHFVSDHPDPHLVAHIAQAFERSGGALMSVYGALLEHPAAWDAVDEKAKQPFELIVSSLRALGVTAYPQSEKNPRRRNILLYGPLILMGQPFRLPPGPDGWPEAIEDWITPQGLAARIQWVMTVPEVLVQGQLPDPREFVQTALGTRASERLRFAASAAESRREGVGLILSSPEFQRR